MTTKVDVLAIAAHRDDVEITSGGLIAKLVDLGYSVGITRFDRRGDGFSRRCFDKISRSDGGCKSIGSNGQGESGTAGCVSGEQPFCQSAR